MKKVLIAVLVVVLFTGCTIFKDSKQAVAPKAKAAVACSKANVTCAKKACPKGCKCAKCTAKAAACAKAKDVKAATCAK